MPMENSGFHKFISSILSDVEIIEFSERLLFKIGEISPEKFFCGIWLSRIDARRQYRPQVAVSYIRRGLNT